MTVINSPAISSHWRLTNSPWWAHVTVTPDASRTAVFNRGTLNGFRGQTPEGGQLMPNSIVGARLLWKKAQKKALKNITSEVMKRIIPHSNPRWTFSVCAPEKEASRVTSRHHKIMVVMMITAARGKVYITPI